MSKCEQNLAKLGITVPEVPAPLAAYVSAMQSGSLVFTSGQTPRKGEGIWTGKVGDTLDATEAYDAARLAAVQSIAALKAELGDLDRVARIVRVTVYVNSAEGFTGQPSVANGASELLQAAFGEQGRHARSAVGVAELPLGACVEVELIAEVHPE
jgi:enamine deaminase RidA (YjgF/YER057c/UK114 family)